MPAAKTLRAQNRKADRNRSTRSFTRNRVRAVTEAIEDGSKSDESDTSLKDAVSALDRAVSKGVMHRNTAARKKSRLTKQYNKLSS
ncbi:MAG: 30S ribosomal protein S20 [Dehalococcoidia bacterium]|jgi:small subunit ribosomal protein S20|nr:30S ribosomal protein S20 [Chloroflexota bacterium]MDP6055915.1 30S ribosomal protein S20 [Dehalococcoidia bacterium]MDP7261421.1 30S ribosomal protein S20 [Dehalococcoidia bacterium]